MKLSRRILAVLLAVLMISASASFAAAAADEPTVAISTAQGKKGKSVEITVSIANNPGIVSMTLNLTYDAAALKLTGVADTGLMPGQMHTTTYTSPYTLTWANDTAPANITVNGTFAKLTFEILTDVVGEYPIMVSVPKDGILDFDVNNIDFRLDHGGITVLSDHTHKTVHYPAAAATCNAGGNIEYWYCAGCNTYFADANGNTKIANAATDKNPANHVGGTEVRGAQPAACSTPGYTGDTYCLGCGAKILSGSSIPATGNHADADNRWESDADGHWHTCGCGAEFDKAAHSGGTATCRDQGVCSVCGFAYLDKNPANHVGGTEVRGAQPAACSTPGYTGDTYCLGCGAKILSGSSIPATGNHADADNRWESDADGHWHTCGCGAEFDKAAHSGGTATCRDQGVCSVCGFAYLDKNPANHVGGTEVRGAQPAACSTPGYTGDTYCLGCGAKILSGSSIPATGNHADADNRWESDANGHWHTCGCGAEFDKAAHSGGTATCRDQGVCSVCGFAYLDKNPANHVGGTEVRGYAAATVGKEGYTGDTYCLGCNTVIERGTVIPKHTHQSGTAWCFDADNHWKVCECGEIMHKAAHTAGDWIIVQEATPGRNGEQQKKCTACGYVMESEAIPATGADLNEWYRFMEMLKNLKFTITAEASEGGTISHEGKTSVQYNTNITYSVTPEEGYAIKAVYVNGKNVGAANEYTFRNVRANQSISVEFVRTAWENPFVDIANDAKYMDAVRFVYENGLFKGISDHEFAPDTTMTRAMFVTVLGRLAGIDTASYTGVRFEDAAAGEWYAPYVEWAAENGIVLGYGNGTFGIDDKITIEQAAVILARYAKHTDEYKDSSIALDNYSDDDTVSDWALEAMKWAVANEVYTGDAGKLNPQEPASRALVAAMIYSYAKGFAGKN